MAQRNSDPSTQCIALLKWIFGTRCSRRAAPGGYLCVQHDRFGATIPQSWTPPERNDYGVLISRPVAPFGKVAARPAPPASPAVTHTGEQGG